MTDRQADLSVVVPAYCEATRIAATVATLHTELATADRRVEVIVVDDGSTDDTAARARSAGADQVLQLPSNRGKGAAVRAGMLAASGRVRCFVDADLAYGPNQILRLVAAVEEGADDADEAVRLAIKRIDKAAQKGVLHKNTAARKKSRLARKLNQA